MKTSAGIICAALLLTGCSTFAPPPQPKPSNDSPSQPAGAPPDLRPAAFFSRLLGVSALDVCSPDAVERYFGPNVGQLMWRTSNWLQLSQAELKALTGGFAGMMPAYQRGHTPWATLQCKLQFSVNFTAIRDVHAWTLKEVHNEMPLCIEGPATPGRHGQAFSSWVPCDLPAGNTKVRFHFVNTALDNVTIETGGL